MSLQVKQPLASDLQQTLHADDCTRIMVVRTQVVQHRDHLLTLDSGLDRHIATVHRVVAKPKRLIMTA